MLIASRSRLNVVLLPLTTSPRRMAPKTSWPFYKLSIARPCFYQLSQCCYIKLKVIIIISKRSRRVNRLTSVANKKKSSLYSKTRSKKKKKIWFLFFKNKFFSFWFNSKRVQLELLSEAIFMSYYYLFFTFKEKLASSRFWATENSWVRKTRQPRAFSRA